MTPPVFFTDRDLGKRFPEILRAAGLTVERHADHFAHDCPDEDWLQSVGRRGWIAITHDSRIRYKPNELAGAMITCMTVAKHETLRCILRLVPSDNGVDCPIVLVHSDSHAATTGTKYFWAVAAQPSVDS